MGIAHGRRSDFIRLRIQPFVQIGFARIQCLRNHKRFDCRTGFDHIGYGTVAPLFAVCPAGPVGIVGGRIGQGEDFPCGHPKPPPFRLLPDGIRPPCSTLHRPRSESSDRGKG